MVIAFLLIMERVEEPLRRPTSQRQVEEFLASATPGTSTSWPTRASAGPWTAGVAGGPAGRSAAPRR
ncbi:hypothetical protein ACFQX8_18085 [Klenkia terrae]|uniref:hypothetical protein n=1 Tax=Klenkia terrae TaxID=1052259 RepID=UPI003618C41D